MSPTFERARLATATIIAIGILAANAATAQTGAKSAPEAVTGDTAAVKKLVEQKFPGATVKGVTKSPYFGLFEVQFDDQIIYTDNKAAYVIVGSVYDTASKKNLTEDRLRKLNRIAFDSLPLDLAIKRVKGNGSRKLVVFSDADCPFCARLENELKGIDDVTIYTFLYPIDSLHPDAARKSKIIWCAPDRLKAWDEFYASGKLPDNKGDCDTPLATLHALGQKLKISATPTLVFNDGSIVPGALPKDRLESEMKVASAEVAKSASDAGKPAADAAKPAAPAAKK